MVSTASLSHLSGPHPKRIHPQRTHIYTELTSLFLYYMFLQLGPWLAVEIPDLIEKGVISYKEKTSQ